MMSLPLALGVGTAHGVLLDDFESLDSWSAHPADGVQLELVSDEGMIGKAMRLDFHFNGGGYAIARRELDLPLSGNYEFRFWMKGEAPSNNLEFKLIDASNENVWWKVRRDMVFSKEWKQVRIKKRQISFAWGPRGSGDLDHAAALEFAISAGSGGEGRIWIDQLELVPLPPENSPPADPIVTSSSSRRGHEAFLSVDGDRDSYWSPRKEDLSPWLLVDFSRTREFSALILDWKLRSGASEYRVEASLDSLNFSELRVVVDGAGHRDLLYLPESEARYLRFRFEEGNAPTEMQLAELRIQAVDWAQSREQFFEHIASGSSRGLYPRGFCGEQSYWTLVGLDGGADEGLLSEDGALEFRQGSFSVEAFLFFGGRLISWADVETEQSLAEEGVPIPSVSWTVGDLSLRTQAFAVGRPDSSALLARYSVYNRGDKDRVLTLYLTIRPFQVDPPSQTLNRAGGTATIVSLEQRLPTVFVNERDRVISLTPGCAFGCLGFDAGDIVVDFLRHGSLPSAQRVEDSFQAASGALSYALEVPAGRSVQVQILIPQSPSYKAPSLESDDASLARSESNWTSTQFEASLASWRKATRTVRVDLPESAKSIQQSLYAQLAYILVNRDGPAIQPGSRSYARSWIRDGTLTSSSLLRLGRADVVRTYLRWYAKFQYENGKVPCAVDHRGADPVPEHDSNGEFIHLVAEYYRHTQDLDLAREMWPRVRSAVAYLDSLRQENLGPQSTTEADKAMRGILPPSISHEGYSAKPMHSYWDDFFAYLGFKDAVYLAGELQEREVQTRYQTILRAFSKDLASSVRATIQAHSIDYIPGCADLGDFDATSTAIAFAPTGAADLLPANELKRTFQRYYDFFQARRESADWIAFTPYEIRNVGAFVRLGWRNRAQELLEFFLAQQKPPGWHQWPEVVFREDRQPHFIGDLPHTWVGSDYIRSILDLFAYEDDRTKTLVVGAGIPRAWLEEEPGVSVQGLSTGYGILDLRMHLAPQGLTVRLSGLDRIPPGGIIVRPPLSQPPRHPQLSGSTEWHPESQGPGVVIHELPATLIWKR